MARSGSSGEGKAKEELIDCSESSILLVSYTLVLECDEETEVDDKLVVDPTCSRNFSWKKNFENITRILRISSTLYVSNQYKSWASLWNWRLLASRCLSRRCSVVAASRYSKLETRSNWEIELWHNKQFKVIMSSRFKYCLIGAKIGDLCSASSIDAASWTSLALAPA